MWLNHVVNAGFPFGVLSHTETPHFTDYPQVPTLVSTLHCSIRTDGQTLDFPGNFGVNSAGPNPTYSSVTNGTFMFIWTITGSADTSGALVLPTITCGTNMVFVQAFSNDSIGGTTTTATPLSTPQSGFNGTGATQSSTTFTLMAIVTFPNTGPLTPGQTFIKMAGSGLHWPTMVTAADCFVLELPATWQGASVLLAKQKRLEESKYTPEEKKQMEIDEALEKKERKRDQLMEFMMTAMAKQHGIKLPDMDETEDDSCDCGDDECCEVCATDEEKKEAELLELKAPIIEEVKVPSVETKVKDAVARIEGSDLAAVVPVLPVAPVLKKKKKVVGGKGVLVNVAPTPLARG